MFLCGNEYGYQYHPFPHLITLNHYDILVLQKKLYYG